MDNMFGITKDEVLNLAAEKVANMAVREEDGGVYAKAMTIVKERIDKLFAERIVSAVEAALKGELETILSETITPVDVWGDKAGKTTTLRAAMRNKSAEFWTQTVDSNGNPSSGYNTKPRWEVVMKKFLSTEFDAVIKQNIVEVIGALKASMRVDLANRCNAVMDELIRVKI